MTSTTVRMVSRSASRSLGSTEAMARAAEAPQMPTAPPERMPKLRFSPRARAATAPKPMVEATPTTTVTIGAGPRLAIWLRVMRAPSSATPTRSTVLEATSIPATHWPSSCRKWKAMPISNANSITGAV